MKVMHFYDGRFKAYSILFGVLSFIIVFGLPFLFTQPCLVIIRILVKLVILLVV